MTLFLALATLLQDSGGVEKQNRGLSAVIGVVTFDGEVPKQSIEDDYGQYRDLLTIHPSSRGLRFAAVWLESLAEPPKDFPEETAENPPQEGPALVRVNQENYRFKPNVLAIRGGTTVAFGNSDDANHNVRAHSDEPRNRMNIVTGPLHRHEKTFHPEPGGGPIRLSCDIHAWMVAWIYVFDHPHFAVTGPSGRFVIGDVPAGPYRVIVQHPGAGLRGEGPIEVVAGIERELTVSFAEDHLEGAKTLALP